MRSGDDWELGSWQPYNPEWPGLQQATHFGTAQPLLIACSCMWKNMRKFPPWPGYRTWCSSQHTCHPRHPLLEILREMTGDGSSKRCGVFMRHQRHSAPKSEVYLNVGMPSTYGPAAASSQDVPSQAGLKDVRRRRPT